MKNPVVLGIIGGIGCGKSTVARMFESHGAFVIDADAICRRLLSSDAIRKKIFRAWAGDLEGPDGKIRRDRLATIVFGKKSAVKQLNAIVHPPVRREMNRLVKSARKRYPLIVVDAPLLLESGYHRRCDRLVYVHVPFPVRKERVRTGRGWSAAELRRRSRMQLPVNEKRRKADDIINNNGTLKETERQVRQLVRGWEEADQS